ncbi:MAG: hypothetical protein H7Z16_16620 [Pyrinomonadaceae bacterium]|nr:hypothetical protein [Pyrinomonadaceae bacterium]
MKSYKAGDTIELSVALTDVSGITKVVAAFRGVQEGRQIWMRANGRGQTSATVVLGTKVEETARPDEYFLQMLAVDDKAGNHKEYTRNDIRFMIEGSSQDTDPPELVTVTLK